MDDMEIEEDDSQEDSFVDGQPNVQLGEAEALARVRSLVGNEVTVDPVDPITPPFPRSMAGHQRSLHTLRVNPVLGSSQSKVSVYPSTQGLLQRNRFSSRYAS